MVQNSKLRRNAMNLLGSRWIVMLGVAMVLAAGSMALAPTLAQQLTPPPAAGSSALLTSSAPGGKGYTDRVVEEMQGRITKDASDSAALSQLGLAYLQKARETNDPAYYTKAEQALTRAL